MKKINKLIALILSCVMITSVGAFAESEDRNVSAVVDTYIYSLYPYKNYSLNKELVVSNTGGEKKNAYISFNVGNLPTHDYRVFLRLTTIGASFDKSEDENDVPSIIVTGLASHEWKQNEITFNSVPKSSSAVASVFVKSDSVIDVDVTDYVKGNISSRGYISFMLSLSYGRDAEIKFSSIESKTAVPQLFIDCNYVEPEKPLEPETKPAEKVYGDWKTLDVPETPVIKYDTVVPWDLSSLPEDMYMDAYTSIPINHYTTNLLTFNKSDPLFNGNMGDERQQQFNGLAVSPINPYRILVGSNCHGIFRSEDGGKTFTMSSEGMNATYISQIAFYPDDDNIVFCSTLGGGPSSYQPNFGVFKSTDSGKSWRKVCDEIGFSDVRVWRLIAFGDKKSSGIRSVYVAGTGTNRTGVWKSDDLGESWTQVLKDVVCKQLDVDGERIVAACDSDGIYISNDGGMTWTNNCKGIEKKVILAATFDPENSEHILAISKDELFESVDGGDSWSLLCDRDFIKANYLSNLLYGPVDKDGHSRLYLGVYSGEFAIRYSDDNGRTWNLFEAPTRGYLGCMLSISEANPDRVYATIDSLMISTDRGDTYEPSHYGIVGARTSFFEFDENNPSNVWFAGVDYGVMRTEPRSDEHFPAISVQAMHRKGVEAGTVGGFARDPSNPDRVLYTTGKQNSGTKKLFESLDGGWNYEPICEDILFDATPILFSKQNADIVYIGSLKSYDGGKTWERLPKSVSAMSDTDHNIVYSKEGGYVYVSEDGGYNWDAYTTKSYRIDRFPLVDADDPYRIYLAVNGGVVIKDKSSETVTKLGTTADGYPIVYMTIAQNPQNHNHIAVGGRDNKYKESSDYIYESYDRGATWRAIPIPPPGDVAGLAFHPTRPEIYYGTSGGTFVYNYENYEKGRPDSHYYDTEGTYCEEAVNYLWEVGYLTEASNLDYGIDKYQYEGDFLDWILKKENLIASRLDFYFEDIDSSNRYDWTVQAGLENGLLLPSDGENGKLNLLFKKLTHGMCAKYLVRLMKIKGMNTDAPLEAVSSNIKSGMSPDVADAVAVLSRYGIITENDVFEFSPEKVAARGEIAVMLSRTLKLFK